VCLGTVLLTDKEFAINFMYDKKNLFLNLVTLVSQLILTFSNDKIILIVPILSSWFTGIISDWPLIICIGILQYEVTKQTYNTPRVAEHTL